MHLVDTEKHIISLHLSYAYIILHPCDSRKREGISPYSCSYRMPTIQNANYTECKLTNGETLRDLLIICDVLSS